MLTGLTISKQVVRDCFATGPGCTIAEGSSTVTRNSVREATEARKHRVRDHVCLGRRKSSSLLNAGDSARLFRKRMARGRILLTRRGRSTITLYISGRMDEVRTAPNAEPHRIQRRNRGSIDNSPHHRSGPSIAWVADAGIHRGNPQEPRCPSAVGIVADPSVVVAAVVHDRGLRQGRSPGWFMSP
jgi:hypothetical protein